MLMMLIGAASFQRRVSPVYADAKPKDRPVRVKERYDDDDIAVALSLTL